MDNTTFRIVTLEKTKAFNLGPQAKALLRLIKTVSKWMKMAGSIGDLLHLKMEQCIQASGLTALEMASALKCGLMAPSTKVSGKMTKQMVKEN